MHLPSLRTDTQVQKGSRSICAAVEPKQKYECTCPVCGHARKHARKYKRDQDLSSAVVETRKKGIYGHVYAVIHSCSPICNMQLNVLNDLAEAMKTLDGKKETRKKGTVHLSSPDRHTNTKLFLHLSEAGGDLERLGAPRGSFFI